MEPHSLGNKGIAFQKSKPGVRALLEKGETPADRYGLPTMLNKSQMNLTKVHLPRLL